MSFPARILPRVWMIVLACALGLLFWCDRTRVERVEAISGLQGRDRPVDVPDARSPTGYAGGQRELIVPEDNKSSYHWIEQTQQMFARGEARVRHVDYEGAPNGHDVNAASPYRWWLGLVAWADHLGSGRPIGLSVERAALFADPLLQTLLVVGAAILVARQFGGFAAAILCVGLVALFPFASGFLPGMPDQRGLASIFALGSILILLAGTNRLGSGCDREGGDPLRRRTYPWFALAGVVGGLGMWISVQTEAPIIAGIILGALFSAWIRRRHTPGLVPVAHVNSPLRIWAYSGGTTVLVAYFAEYFPSHMGSMRMESVHPAYGLAWIGAGELLSLAVFKIRGVKGSLGRRGIPVTVLAAAGVATVPASMWATGSWGFLVQYPGWARLTWLTDGAVAPSSGAWLLHGGGAPAAWATLLPVAAIGPAAWMMLRGATRLESRTSLAVALGPVLVAGGFACQQLGWWSVFDAALLALFVAASAEAWNQGKASGRWLWAAMAAITAIAGLIQLLPPGAGGPALAPTSRESEELVERHLGHWLARRAGGEGTVVFSPPNESTGMCFYGGLHGIGSFAPDNREGFGATLTIAAAPSMVEAHGDLLARGVKYLVIPSWDPFFDEFARRYLDKRFASRPSFFIGELRRWNLPPWLRPIPYQMPVGGGFEGQSVLVFEVVDEQAPAAAAGRLAEYLVEMGDLEKAASIGDTLRRFPGDVGALAARMQVLDASGDAAAAAKTLEILLSRLTSGADRYLPWDRRVSVAIVLAQAGRMEVARGQARRCFTDVSEARLRSLTTGSLFNLLVLGHAFGIEIADPGLRAIAIDLLPDDLRSRL